MTTCVPVRDLKNTSKFADFVHSAAEPVIITKNGYEDMVVMTAAYYDAFTAKLERLSYDLAARDADLERAMGYADADAAQRELDARVDIAEQELAAGKFIDAKLAKAKLKAKYGI